MKIRRVPTINPSHTIEYWYDGSAGVTSWCVRTVDENDYQIGDATYVYTLREALRDVSDRQAEESRKHVVV